MKGNKKSYKCQNVKHCVNEARCKKEIIETQDANQIQTKNTKEKNGEFGRVRY